MISTASITSASVPDARCVTPRGVMLHKKYGNLTPVFCVNCGADGGMAMEYTPAIIYLCQKCEGYGGLPLPKLEIRRDT